MLPACGVDLLRQEAGGKTLFVVPSEAQASKI